VPILTSSFERFAPSEPPSTIKTIEDSIVKIGRLLRRRVEKGERIMILAGVDLSHVGPRFGDREELTPAKRQEIEKQDRAGLEHVLALKADDFYRSVVSDGNKRKVCGLSALYTAVRLIQAMEPERSGSGKLLSYGQADDPAGGMVSFAGAIFPASPVSK
jgi:AmmeMemoRadiSam system protein B